MTKRVVFSVRSQDGERTDSVAFEPGAILSDLTATKKHNPMVAISAVQDVRLVDDDDLKRWSPDRLRAHAAHLRRFADRIEAGANAKELRMQRFATDNLTPKGDIQ
jgi:hypothetical protein